MLKLPMVYTSEEIIDYAFRKAFRKKQVPIALKGKDRRRYVERVRLEQFEGAAQRFLYNVVRGFPSVDSLHPFYRELISTFIDVDRLKHSLGAAEWAYRTVRRILRQHRRLLRAAESEGELIRIRKSATGRFSSVIKQISPELEFLKSVAVKLDKLATIDTDTPSVVLAGAPNTGKSTLLKRITRAKPKIAEYPFTTKNIIVGHMELGEQVVQVIDTPGILDRPLEEHNKVERRAIAAIRHLATVVVFLIDPTETCGYPLESQLAILDSLMQIVDRRKFIVTANKSDLETFKYGLRKLNERVENILVVSAATGQGISRLLEEVSMRIGDSG